MYRIIFLILCIIMLSLFSSCARVENIERLHISPHHSTENISIAPFDMKKLMDDFMVAIDSVSLMDVYSGDYGLKVDYIYGNETLEEFHDGYITIKKQLYYYIEKISDTTENSLLKDFKRDLINLLKQKNDLLDEQTKAILEGGKWPVKFKHGANINVNMALEHYGNNGELLKKIEDYNFSAKEFIKKYEMDTQKYEFGDEKIIFLIY